jgi:hypothetical protein
VRAATDPNNVLTPDFGDDLGSATVSSPAIEFVCAAGKSV